MTDAIDGPAGAGVSGARVVRTVAAPTREEAAALAAPMVAAFTAAGWYEQERVWIPGDRRVGLGESLLLNPSQELLLEADGDLRIAFVHPDPRAVPPTAGPAVRQKDVFERIGGTRYRRLAPRMAIGCVVSLVLLAGFVVLAGPIVREVLDGFGGAGGIQRIIDGHPFGEGSGTIELEGMTLTCDVDTGECR